MVWVTHPHLMKGPQPSGFYLMCNLWQRITI